MPIIELKDVTYFYDGTNNLESRAIRNVSFAVEKGEYIGVIGHTGSGKSTLIKHLNCILRPTYGKVYIDGVDVWSDKKVLSKIRRKVGLVFQYPEYQLFEETIEKDIAFGPKNLGLNKEEVERRVMRAAQMVEIDRNLLFKSPFEISGGEKRRVAIAGILAMEPDILVLDEPAAGLDPIGKEKILKIIEHYHKYEKRTVIHVTHSMEDIAKYADKILIMNSGEVVSYDSVDNTFKDVDMLKNIGLDIPQITKVFFKLRKKGFNIPSNIYTVEDAVDIVKNILIEKERQ